MTSQGLLFWMFWGKFPSQRFLDIEFRPDLFRLWSLWLELQHNMYLGTLCRKRWIEMAFCSDKAGFRWTKFQSNTNGWIFCRGSSSLQPDSCFPAFLSRFEAKKQRKWDSQGGFYKMIGPAMIGPAPKKKITYKYSSPDKPGAVPTKWLSYLQNEGIQWKSFFHCITMYNIPLKTFQRITWSPILYWKFQGNNKFAAYVLATASNSIPISTSFHAVGVTGMLLWFMSQKMFEYVWILFCAKHTLVARFAQASTLGVSRSSRWSLNMFGSRSNINSTQELNSCPACQHKGWATINHIKQVSNT